MPDLIPGSVYFSNSTTLAVIGGSNVALYTSPSLVYNAIKKEMSSSPLDISIIPKPLYAWGRDITGNITSPMIAYTITTA